MNGSQNQQNQQPQGQQTGSPQNFGAQSPPSGPALQGQQGPVLQGQQNQALSQQPPQPQAGQVPVPPPVPSQQATSDSAQQQAQPHSVGQQAATSQSQQPHQGTQQPQGQGTPPPQNTNDQGNDPSSGQPRRRGEDEKQKPDYRSRSEKFRKEREIIRAREVDTDMGKRLGALAVPFIFLAILALIVAFILIPFSTEIVETRDNTRLLLDDIERNEDKIETLMNIDLTTLDRHLEVASVVVRDEMDVSEMAIEVERLALKHDLVPKSQNTSNTEDVVVAASTLDTDWVPSYADVVSGPFNFTGTFENVCGFLRDLRLNSKTILSLGQIQINRGTGGLDDDFDGTGGDYWSINLLISGYTAEPQQDVNVADPIRTDIDTTILQEIYTRAGEEFKAEVTEEEESETEEGTDSGEGETEIPAETPSESE